MKFMSTMNHGVIAECDKIYTYFGGEVEHKTSLTGVYFMTFPSLANSEICKPITVVLFLRELCSTLVAWLLSYALIKDGQ